MARLKASAKTATERCFTNSQAYLETNMGIYYILAEVNAKSNSGSKMAEITAWLGTASLATTSISAKTIYILNQLSI